MQTSDLGVRALILEEGDVLRAYRCPAGKWTIGPGLTAASGVVVPKPGMVITKAESARLTKLALARNYEPAVTAALPGAKQHEFDAGISFHWNTGAIRKASWVPLWVKKAARPLIEAKFRQWNKGAGKVLPGLMKRRERELAILFDAKYPVSSEPKSKSVSVARWALPMTIVEKANVVASLHVLGYRGGTADQLPAYEVRRFQSDHGLTADGIIGRATLSTLQRRLDAAAKAKPAAAAATAAPAAAAGGSATDITDQIAGASWALPLLAGAAVLWCAWLTWQYRDVIAVKLNARAPKVAAWLRSL
ncbi:peptidoglycan-binding protein [Paenirhodobacter sp. CAU 1674]|uniref:glycoside hydrolase family protein n=1 Tax=Paenirhodobacter sp. CAU 1674 TaxID=3032596 RepID=UPI0023D9D850|nr:peptidoglycan-binding protein [Paenirhodobacter sp. CAU 1674]MDF2141231.1 peptidoglycan-binding protein [Paenirhodobacter sp. CAU 1674]